MKLPDFQLERFFAQHEFTAKHLLCSSDCEAMTVGDLLTFEPDAKERFQDLWLGYTESAGSPTLREAICQIYETVNTDDVLVFAGAEEAIFLFLYGMLDDSDHAIVHYPCYQSLFQVAHDAAGQVDAWQANADDGWKLDLDDLKSLLRPNTKAIVVNTPHNPTGYLMDRSDWKELHELAAERGIIVFCDEVYRESEYEIENRLPAGCDMSEHAVSLGVMSKTYGLPGLRIGWVASKNTKVMNRLRSSKDYTTICNSAPSEFLAELGLRHRERLVARSQSIIQTNLKLLDEFFDAHPKTLHWNRPGAGSIAFPKLLSQPVDSFCQELLEKTGVLLAPAFNFQYKENHFRIGFGRQDMKDGLSKLSNFIAS